MVKNLVVAGAAAVGLALSVSMAGAAPVVAPSGSPANSDVVQVRKDGGGGGGGMRGFSGGGKSFGGGSMRGYGGGGGKAFRSFGGGGGGMKYRNFGGDGGFRGMRRGRHAGHHHHHHHHHKHRRFRSYGYPYYYGPAYYSYYGGYGDCGWLRRRAIRTGSSYWWRRYDQCISGY